MPVLVYLRNPQIIMAIEGEINPDDKMVVKQYEDMYGQGTLVATTDKGNPVVIPARGDLNVAYLQGISDKELKEMRRKEEERKKQMEEEARKRAGNGGKITRPTFTPNNLRFPKKH